MSFKLDDDYYNLTQHSPVSKDKLEELRRYNNKLFFPSTFGFLNAHNGLRPGCFHGLLSSTGAGKSSLVKAIIAQTAEVCKVGVLLTEEKPPMYQMGINLSNDSQDVLDNIIFLDDTNISKIARTPVDFMNYLSMMVVSEGIKALFIDNVTTGSFYGDHIPFNQQKKSIDILMDVMHKTGVLIFYVAHTRKEITDNMPRLLTPEDIRGSAMLPMKTEYFYTMQKFEGKEKQYNVIRICKHRYHEKAVGFFQLEYENGRYTKDFKVPFDSVNNIFKERDRLGKT